MPIEFSVKIIFYHQGLDFFRGSRTENVSCNWFLGGFQKGFFQSGVLFLNSMQTLSESRYICNCIKVLIKVTLNS